MLSCSRCTILVGPTQGNITITDCTRCNITVACHGIKLVDCTDVKIKLFTMTDPIIQGCSKIAFNTWNVAFPKAVLLFKKSHLDLSKNKFRCVIDKHEGDLRIATPHYYTEDVKSIELVKVDVRDHDGNIVDTAHEIPTEMLDVLKGNTDGGDENFIKIGPLKLSPSSRRPSPIESPPLSSTPEVKPIPVSSLTGGRSTSQSAEVYVPRFAMATAEYRRVEEECKQLEANLPILREKFKQKAESVDALLQSILNLGGTTS
jgi:hypothetical protein